MTKRVPDRPAPSRDSRPAPAAAMGFGADEAFAFLAQGERAGTANIPPPRETAPLGAPPPARTPQQVYAAVYWQTKDLLALGRTAALVAQAMAAAHRIAEQAWSAMRPSVEARAKPFDCAKGCGWCCHQHVSVHPAEATAIARWLDTRTSEPSRGQRFARIQQTQAKIAGATMMERRKAQVPCPFLDDGACSIHPVRPMRCRGFFSRDVGLCRATFDDPAAGVNDPRWQDNDALPREPTRLFDAAIRAVATALHEAGLSADTLELTASLALIGHDPGAVERWIAGEEAFAPARMPPRTPAKA